MLLDGQDDGAHGSNGGQRAAAGKGGGKRHVEPPQHARHAATAGHQVQRHGHDKAQRGQAHCTHEAHDLSIDWRRACSRTERWSEHAAEQQQHLHRHGTG